MMRSLLTLLLFFVVAHGQAWHIVGGEVYYKCLGNNQYEIVVKVYRDCYSTGAPFDGIPGGITPMRIFIFDAFGNQAANLNPAPVITNIPPDASNPCLIAPPNICVEEGFYIDTVTLQPSTGGYNIVYQRCCRNQTIVNLNTPQSQGATYVQHIPDPGGAICNSSPYFNEFPPIIICANDPLNFDHSATDPDGDSLVYELCEPYIGGSNMDPAPNPASTPPYTSVSYATGYNPNYPLDATPPLSIDPQTGLLTGTPTNLGQYVVGVCVKEYRNGVLLGIHRRDFQFNIANCNPSVIADIPAVAPDTMLNACNDYTINFGNASIGASTYFWDFGDPSTTADTSNVQFPTYTYPDTGIFKAMLIANPGLVCSDTDYIHVLIFPYLEPKFTYDTACPYEPVIFEDHTINTYGNVISWKWFFGDGNTSTSDDPSHTYGTGSSYNVTLQVETDKGCKGAVSQQINLHPIPNASFTFDTACLFVPITFDNKSTISTGVIDSCLWDFGETGGTSTDKDPQYIYNSEGNYLVSLIAISDNGCRDTTERSVTINPLPLAVASGDTALCYGFSTRLHASGSLYYSWEPAASVDDPSSPYPIVTPAVTTTYTVTVSDTCGSDTATVTVVVNQLPVVGTRSDTSLLRRDSVWVTGWGTGKEFYWSPSSTVSDPYSPNTFMKPTETTTYTLKTVDEHGCEKTDEITIYVRDVCNRFYMPNAFSPNGDGRNDEFRIAEFGDNDLVKFEIYNRWGRKVFETSDISRGWNGRLNGHEQEMGTYGYMILMNCDEKVRKFTGNVTLLR